jgi:hypothetical protein
LGVYSLDFKLEFDSAKQSVRHFFHKRYDTCK